MQQNTLRYCMKIFVLFILKIHTAIIRALKRSLPDKRRLRIREVFCLSGVRHPRLSYNTAPATTHIHTELMDVIQVAVQICFSGTLPPLLVCTDFIPVLCKCLFSSLNTKWL